MADYIERRDIDTQRIDTVKPSKLSRAVSACHDFTYILLILSMAAWEEGCGENGLPRWEIYAMRKATTWLRKKRSGIKSFKKSLRDALQRLHPLP